MKLPPRTTPRPASRAARTVAGLALVAALTLPAGRPALGSSASPGDPALAGLGADGLAPAVPGRQERTTRAGGGAPEAFGFAYGEERRYEMGPQDALNAGEAATWGIRLEEVREDDPGRFATFVLTHDYDAAPPRSITYQQGELVTLRFDGRLTVNAAGFPVELRFEVARDLFGLGQQTYTVDYAWDDEHFVKRVRIEGTEWEIPVGAPSHEHLDRAAPAGAFAWLADGLRCMGRKPVLDAFGRLEMARYCTGGEWAFANPGLLSLALPALYEAGGDRSFLFFGPTGPDLYGGLASTVGGPPRTRSGAFGRPPADGDIGRARDPLRYFERADVSFDERVEVEVGGRTLEVWRLDVDGRVRAVYLDDDDRIVRVDVEPHPVTNKGRWIRLLFPSEF